MQKKREDLVFTLFCALESTRVNPRSLPTPQLPRYMPFFEISRALRSISCFVATTSAAAV